MRTARISIGLLMAVTLSLLGPRGEATAQAPAPPPSVGVGLPSFEAISVKESKGTRIPVQWQGPRFVAGAIPLQTLLIVAYQVPPYQLAGLPEWVRTTPYEINALASRVPTQTEQTLLLRALLAERFGIVARTETQDRPMYALVRARSDGRPGPGLRPTSTDCLAVMSGRAAPGAPGNGPTCGTAISPGAYKRDGVPLATLVDFLTSRLERPTVDRTGLTGFFDVELRYRPLGGGANAQAAGADEPDLITALADQLGLKVDSIRGPVQVTVFDRLERPRPD